MVQVGAFADAAHAQEVRQKLERAGLKTYTHVAETKEGKRIRVRTRMWRRVLLRGWCDGEHGAVPVCIGCLAILLLYTVLFWGLQLFSSGHRVDGMMLHGRKNFFRLYGS